MGGGSKRIQLNVKGQSDQYSTLFRATYLLLTYWLLIIEIAKNQSLEDFCLSSDVNTNHKVAAAAKVCFFFYIFFYVNETLSACYLSPFVSAACLAPVPSLLIKLFTLLDEAIATVSGEATSTATEEGKKMTL